MNLPRFMHFETDRITIRQCLAITLVFCAMGSECWASERPNIVLIISDDQSWDTFSFLGGKVHTPRLDQMAKDGMYFSNFHVTTTVCSPSRYSFLTGRYAGRCKSQHFLKLHPPGTQTQVENNVELEPHLWNLAKILQRAGYRTGFVGKSHIIRHDWLRAKKGWPQNANPRNPKIMAMMREHHQKWCKEMKKYGFDYVDGIYPANLKELGCDALNVHNLDWTVDKAIRFLESSKDRPFFLCVCTTLHHGPAPWVNRYSLDADPRMTSAGFVPRGFNVLPSRKDVLKRNRKAGFKDRKAFALWLDDGVGAIIDKVKDLGIEKNTLITFAPDHGSYRHGKTTLHGYGMRVPMLCQWPGTIKAGSRYDGLVANIDFAPTVLDLCGVARPKDCHVDGLSFKTVLKGNQRPIREVLFGEMGHARCVVIENWRYIAVRYPTELQKKIDNGMKFKAFKNKGWIDRPYLTRNKHLGYYASKVNPHYFESDQLYDQKNDREENHNVFNKHPGITRLMKQLLTNALRKFNNRPFGEFTTN